jgi:hypothetical protein
MKQLRERIIRLLENGEINNLEEREKLEHLLKTKKWNFYCIRGSVKLRQYSPPITQNHYYLL